LSNYKLSPSEADREAPPQPLFFSACAAASFLKQMVYTLSMDLYFLQYGTALRRRIAARRTNLVCRMKS
jgi:hypothetical protein